MKFYPLGDTPTREECEAFELRRSDVQGPLPSFGGPVVVKGTNGRRQIQAVYAGEKRCPRKGEWYLSGAIVAAYRAPNDLSSEYHIARLVVTETRTETRTVLI